MNPIVIRLGSLHTITERFGKRRGRKLYSKEAAAEILNVSSAQLENMTLLCSIRPSFIVRFEGCYFSEQDIAEIRQRLRSSFFDRLKWWQK